MKGVHKWEDFSDLLRFIPELDREFLRAWHEEQESKSTKNNKKPPVRNR